MGLPANIRIQTPVPFPNLVQGSGPITVNKMNGIWTIGYSTAGLPVQGVPQAGSFPTTFVVAYDSVAKTTYNLPLSAFSSGILLNTLVAANSATLQDVTSLTLGYNEYSMVFENIVPVTTAVSFELQVQSGGTFQTTGYINSAGTLTNCIDLLQAATLANTAGIGFSGSVTLFGKTNAATINQARGAGSYLNSSAGVSNSVCAGWWNTAGALTGLQFRMSSGNISTGTIKIYGSL